MLNTFRFSEVLQYIDKHKLRQLIPDKQVILLARKIDWYGDESLVEIAAKFPHATIALRSALANHRHPQRLSTSLFLEYCGHRR
ncbi:hypothetical protein [Mycobacterium lepromatosis]|uniref:hypothetical protein n=1 Tax=Mycobacterium lepromatosis TaxID=480418 RepID=UPI000AA8C575|nr:hypothetical protein [Mycobacterium lepromatosis]